MERASSVSKPVQQSRRSYHPHPPRELGDTKSKGWFGLASAHLGRLFSRPRATRCGLLCRRAITSCYGDGHWSTRPRSNTSFNLALDLLTPRLQPGNARLVTRDTDHQPAHAGMKTHEVGILTFADPELSLNLPDVPCRDASSGDRLSVGLHLRTLDFQNTTAPHEPVGRYPDERKFPVVHESDQFDMIPGLPGIPRTSGRLMVDAPLHRRCRWYRSAMSSQSFGHQLVNERRIGARSRPRHRGRKPRTRDSTKARLVPLW